MDRRTITGKRIAAIRQHRGITQDRLAAAINGTQSAIHHIEHGRTDVTTERLEALAKALHCLPADLLAPLDAPMPRVRFRGGGQERPPLMTPHSEAY